MSYITRSRKVWWHKLESLSLHPMKTGDEWSPDLELEDLGLNLEPTEYYMILRTFFDISRPQFSSPKMIIKISSL